MKIGILGTSEIALRRFLPALSKSKDFTYAGVATRNINNEKAKAFQDQFGGQIYDGYDALLKDDSIDAVYVPLPPALHFKWGKKVLESGKHLFMEKPFTLNSEEAEELVNMAKEKGLAIHENYMFVFHKQLKEIDGIVKSGTIGDVRLYRIAFGFPKRAEGDFRYIKELGGGSLLDAGGYTIKLASMLLGPTAKIKTSTLNYTKDYDVDLYGSATMVNGEGLTAQLAFGMDNSYKCELEIWGSLGVLKTNRILTAPVGFTPTVEITINNETKIQELASDDTFLGSINKFNDCINNKDIRERNYKEILQQVKLIDKIIKEGDR